MILGIGCDLCMVSRIRGLLRRFGCRFQKRCFTETENQRAVGRFDAAVVYARLFACKEACSKALGTGLDAGVSWRDVEVLRMQSGCPSLRLRGKALQHCLSLVPSGMQPRLSVSASSDGDFAQSFVILWAEPRRKTKKP